MKLAFIHPNHPEGEGTGATHSATQIVDCAKELGHEVTTYCTTAPTQDLVEECKLLLADEHSRHTAIGLNRAIKNRRDEFEKFDVLHSYLPSTIPALNYISKNTATSTAVTLNAFGGVCPKNDLLYMDETQCRDNSTMRCLKCSIATSGGHSDYSPVYRSISRLGNLHLIKQVSKESIEIDGFHALSEHVKDTYTEFGYPENRIKTIPNILDEQFLVKHQSNFSEPYQLLYVGALERHKGVEMLPDLVSYLDSESQSEFELNIVGTGGLQEDLKEECSRLNISNRVNFVGYVQNDDLPTVYAKHDLFVYPGICDEAFGRVFLESLAAGTPVVGTDVGAVDSITGSAGEVTRPNPELLAEKIKEVIASSRIESLAKDTKTEVRRFSVDRVKIQFDQFYREIQ